jgi:preprotein translocase subunit Sss1
MQLKIRKQKKTSSPLAGVSSSSSAAVSESARLRLLLLLVLGLGSSVFGLPVQSTAPALVVAGVSSLAVLSVIVVFAGAIVRPVRGEVVAGAVDDCELGVERLGVLGLKDIRSLAEARRLGSELLDVECLGVLRLKDIRSLAEVRYLPAQGVVECLGILRLKGIRSLTEARRLGGELLGVECLGALRPKDIRSLAEVRYLPAQGVVECLGVLRLNDIKSLTEVRCLPVAGVVECLGILRLKAIRSLAEVSHLPVRGVVAEVVAVAAVGVTMLGMVGCIMMIIMAFVAETTSMAVRITSNLGFLSPPGREREGLRAFPELLVVIIIPRLFSGRAIIPILESLASLIVVGGRDIDALRDGGVAVDVQGGPWDLRLGLVRLLVLAVAAATVLILRGAAATRKFSAAGEWSGADEWSGIARATHHFQPLRGRGGKGKGNGGKDSEESG